LVEKEAPNVEALSPDVLKGIRILAVDDEESAREIVSATLERFGATVKLASSVIDGLRIFESWKPDLVVTDIGMPGYDGYDFIHRLKMMMNNTSESTADKKGNRTPVVALTAFASLQDRTRALAEGFDRYITKPVNMNELVSTVADLLAPITQAD
jgi:CheY-like chemotaxis protein